MEGGDEEEDAICTVNSRFTVHTSPAVASDNKPIAAIKINRYLGNRSVNFYEANISGNDMLFKAAIIFQLVNNFCLKAAGGRISIINRHKYRNDFTGP